MGARTKIKRLDHIGIAVEDRAPTLAFLESLGLASSAEFEVPDGLGASFFKVADSALALIQMVDPEVGARRLKGEAQNRIDHICFEVETLDDIGRRSSDRTV